MRRLAIARLLWALLTALIVALTAAAVLPAYEAMAQVCDLPGPTSRRSGSIVGSKKPPS